MYPNSNQLTWYNHEDVLFEAYKDVVLAGIGVGTYTKFASKRRDSERVTQAKKRILEQHKTYCIQTKNIRLQKECSTHEAGAFKFWLPLVLK